MKLLVCDVEGTIFKANYKIDGTDFSSTMWQPLAHCLGPAAIDEELETHRKWENEEYSNYMEWVDETCKIHKKYGLTKNQFDHLIMNAEYMPGVMDFFRDLDRTKYIPVLISGGFEELILRAQNELGIKHGFGACKYIFNSVTSKLENWNLNHSDFEGKYDFVRSLCSAFKLNRLTDWIFIGDGKNDVPIAKRAPLSFGINAHSALAQNVTYNVSDFHNIRHFIENNEQIDWLSSDAILSEEVVERMEAGKALIQQRDAIMLENQRISAELEQQELQMKCLHNLLVDARASLASGKDRLNDLESSRKQLIAEVESMQNQLELADKRILEIGGVTETTFKSAQTELKTERSRVESLKSKLLKKDSELRRKDGQLNQSTYELDELEKRVETLTNMLLARENHGERFANKFEQLVVTTLKEYGDDWVVIPNFESNPGKKTKGIIDCLVITKSCIVIIEAKNYRGTILSEGDMENNRWYCENGGYHRPILTDDKNPIIK